MGIAYRGFLNFTITILVALSCLHCSGQHETGGQDTGGGSVFYSDSVTVNAALDRALKLATEPDPSKNIFVQFWKARGQSD